MYGEKEEAKKGVEGYGYSLNPGTSQHNVVVTESGFERLVKGILYIFNISRSTSREEVRGSRRVYMCRLVLKLRANPTTPNDCCNVCYVRGIDEQNPEGNLLEQIKKEPRGKKKCLHVENERKICISIFISAKRRGNAWVGREVHKKGRY